MNITKQERDKLRELAEKDDLTEFAESVDQKTILALLDMIDRPAASGDVQANLQASTYPAEIWLQVGGDCEPEECKPFDEHYEITWSQDQIDSMDVHYVRADIAASAERAPVVGLIQLAQEYRAHMAQHSIGKADSPVDQTIERIDTILAAANGEQK